MAKLCIHFLGTAVPIHFFVAKWVQRDVSCILEQNKHCELWYICTVETTSLVHVYEGRKSKTYLYRGKTTCALMQSGSCRRGLRWTMTLDTPVDLGAGFGWGHRATSHLLDLFELVNELNTETQCMKLFCTQILQVVLHNNNNVFLFFTLWGGGGWEA